MTETQEKLQAIREMIMTSLTSVREEDRDALLDAVQEYGDARYEDGFTEGDRFGYHEGLAATGAE